MSPAGAGGRFTSERNPGVAPADRPTLRGVAEFDPLENFASERDDAPSSPGPQRPAELAPLRAGAFRAPEPSFGGYAQTTSEPRRRLGPLVLWLFVLASTVAGVGALAQHAVAPERSEQLLTSATDFVGQMREKVLGVWSSAFSPTLPAPSVPSGEPSPPTVTEVLEQGPPPSEPPQPQDVVPAPAPGPWNTDATRGPLTDDVPGGSPPPAMSAATPTAGPASPLTTPPARVAPQRTIAPPMGSLYINARPWADVWIDGRLVGTTPLANLRVAVGAHEVMWRHPQLGERRQTVEVSGDSATRIGMDLRP